MKIVTIINSPKRSAFKRYFHKKPKYHKMTFLFQFRKTVQEWPELLEYGCHFLQIINIFIIKNREKQIIFKIFFFRKKY